MDAETRRPRRRVRHVLVIAAALGSLLCRTIAPADEPPLGAIRFRGHFPLGAAEGEFRRWHITDALIDEDHPERSTVAVVVDLTSVDTGNDTRDRHLRGADFLDVERYPTATIRVSGIEMNDAQDFTASVQLDLHGRSKTFPMRFAVVDRAARRIAGRITLKRSDFGVGNSGSLFNPLHVDDDVQVMVETVVPMSQDSRTSLLSGHAEQ
jgi:polyisoprenoid-binding protein YceI